MFKNNYCKSLFILLLITVILIPLIYLPYQSERSMSFKVDSGLYRLLRHDNIYKPKVDFMLLMTVLMLIIYYFGLKKNKIDWNYYSPFLAILLFTLFIVFSSLLSRYSYTVYHGRPFRWEGLLTYTGYLSLLLLASQLIDNRKKILYSVKGLFISASIVSFYGFVQYLGFDFITRDPVRVNWSRRVFSTLGNPNFAGSYIILLLPVTVILFITADTKKYNYLYGLLTFVFYSFLIITYTRSAWISFIIILPLIFWLLKNKIKQNKFKIVVLFLVLILITGVIDWYGHMYFRNRLFSLAEESGRLLTGTEDEVLRTGSNRTYILIHSLPLLLENPFWGSGLDTFDRVFPQDIYQEYMNTTTIVDKAHNEYLQLGVTAGLPALFCYLIFLFLIIKKAVINIRKRDPLQLALFFSMIAYLIQAFGNISVVSVAPVFWFILGLNIVYNYKIV